MQVQYIYDEDGRKTGLIVPLSLWQDLTKKKRSLRKVRHFDPGKFRGLYRNLSVDIEKALRNLRQEWERV